MLSNFSNPRYKSCFKRIKSIEFVCWVAPQIRPFLLRPHSCLFCLFQGEGSMLTIPWGTTCFRNTNGASQWPRNESEVTWLCLQPQKIIDVSSVEDRNNWSSREASTRARSPCSNVTCQASLILWWYTAANNESAAQHEITLCHLCSKHNPCKHQFVQPHLPFGIYWWFQMKTQIQWDLA